MFEDAPVALLRPQPDAWHSLVGRVLRPRGAMRVHLGRRYPTRKLAAGKRGRGKSFPWLNTARAFAVPALIGQTIRVERTNQISGAIAELLSLKLPGIPWAVEKDWSGPFHKYQLIHGSIPAPPDELLHEPMSLEIFGELVQIDGIDLASDAGRAWTERQMQVYRMAEGEIPELTGQMVIAIKSATYANVVYPGVGVPFYM